MSIWARFGIRWLWDRLQTKISVHQRDSFWFREACLSSAKLPVLTLFRALPICRGLHIVHSRTYIVVVHAKLLPLNLQYFWLLRQFFTFLQICYICSIHPLPNHVHSICLGKPNRNHTCTFSRSCDCIQCFFQLVFCIPDMISCLPWSTSHFHFQLDFSRSIFTLIRNHMAYASLIDMQSRMPLRTRMKLLG